MKEKIAKEKGWEASQQKLIYSGVFIAEYDAGYLAYKLLGKILQDANTVESYKIEEKGFIVCMISKVCSSPHLNCAVSNQQNSLRLRRPLLRPLRKPPRLQLRP